MGGSVNRPTPLRILAALVLARSPPGAQAQPTPTAGKPGTGPVAPPVSTLPSQVVVDILGAKGARIPLAIPVTIALAHAGAPEGRRRPVLHDAERRPRRARASSSSRTRRSTRRASARRTRARRATSGRRPRRSTSSTRASRQETDASVVVEAQLWDLGTLKPILGQKYSGPVAAARRIAHTLANDLTRQFTGKPGPFLTKIAFVSDRDEPRVKEVYTMDFDGESQRRVTNSRTLSLAPDWSPDGKKIVYQSYEKDTPGVFLIGRDGADKFRVPLSTQLNASPSFSPDGKTIAFCGSVRGNPEIYTVQSDGSGLKRLTENVAIDSTPALVPERARAGLHVQPPGLAPDLHDGSRRARTCAACPSRATGTTRPPSRRTAGGSPSPAGTRGISRSASWRSRRAAPSRSRRGRAPTRIRRGRRTARRSRGRSQRGSSTQIAVANADGSAMRIVTSAGNNFSPAWIKTLE